MKRGQSLPDGGHVMRRVPHSKQQRDANDNCVGFLPAAFELRPGEDDLSVNWLEYFAGTHASNVAACIQSGGAHFKGGAKTRYGVAQVARVKAVAKHNSKPVKVVYAPTKPNNLSHAAIVIDQPVPGQVHQALALEFYKEHY